MCRDFNLPEVSRLLSTICDFKRPAFFLTLRKALPLLSLFRILELEVNFSPSASSWGSLPEDNVDVSIPIDGFRITTSSLWSIKEELEEKEFEDGDEYDGFKDIVFSKLMTSFCTAYRPSSVQQLLYKQSS